MDFFEILGIEPTVNKTEIKRAFSKKLKECPPEKDAAGYQNLRAAYDKALLYADGKNTDDEDAGLIKAIQHELKIRSLENHAHENPAGENSESGSSLLDEEWQDEGNDSLAHVALKEIQKLRNAVSQKKKALFSFYKAAEIISKDYGAEDTKRERFWTECVIAILLAYVGLIIFFIIAWVEA